MKYVEKWLNDVLGDCEELKIAGAIQGVQAPLFRYEIERHQLIEKGVSNQFIDTIYKSLYMHTCGFYQLIKNCTKNSEKGAAEMIKS